MQNRHIAIGVIVLVALLATGYYGCLAAPSGTEAALGDIGTEPGPEMPPLPVGDAGTFPSLPPSIPDLDPPALAAVPSRCGGLTCPSGSICCPSTGECFDANCTDCCPLITIAPELPDEVPSGEEPGVRLPPPR